MKKAIIACVMVLAFTVTASARTITVGLGPGYDFNTIQAAIDDSNDGDTVLVAPGIYTGPGNRDIDFLGKPITVRSSAPKNQNVVAATIIDCNGTVAEPHRGFYFHSGEDANSVLEGFTITNGCSRGSYWAGGGILCLYTDANPTIRNCIITGNQADTGGGIYIDSSPRIINCIVTNNYADTFGGGIACWVDCSAKIFGCIIAENEAFFDGGGIHSDWGSPSITNCTIVHNSAGNRGNSLYFRDSRTDIINSIVWSRSGDNIWFYSTSSMFKVSINYSDIKDCWFASILGKGNICVWPDIMVLENYRLYSDSPCIDTGDPNYLPGHNETDIDGDDRVIGGRVDMGADEYCLVTQPQIEVWPAYMGFVAVADTTNPAPQTLNVRNIGVDTLNWQLYEDCNWLSVWPTSGQSLGEVNEVVISVDSSDIECGEYNCIITIYDSNALNTPQSVNVDLYVGTPIIGVDTKKISFYSDVGGPSPNPKILSIWNDDVGTLDWQITEDCDWLDVSPTSGQSSGEVNEVLISVDADDLEYGIYDCPVTIYNSSVPSDIQTVNVKLYCGITWNVPGEYPTIQDAIDAAVEGGTVIVAPGTYKGEGNRDLDFRGKDITVRGESGAESCIIDCNGTVSEPHRGFYFHSGEDSESILDGFTITNGYHEEGGAIYCGNSSPMITNCIITGNITWNNGGGIYCWDSSPKISNCTISGNMGGAGGGISGCGGPITNCLITGNTIEGGSGAGLSECTGPITNCTITNNTAIDASGGGLSGCSGPISNCTITGNIADEGGGLLYCEGPITNCTITGNIGYGNGGGLWGCNGSISNCTITGNGTRGRGGGLEWCNGSITNCNISGNWSQYGGGISSCFDGLISNCTIVDNASRSGGGALDECDGTITNCIIWNNNDTTGAQLYGCSKPTFSCIQNWSGGGEHNISDDPCFVELGSGYWDDNNTPYPWDDFWVGEIGDYHLLPNSPCIDTGDPNYIPEPNETDLDGNPRLLDGNEDGIPVVDMGAYEYMPPIPAEVNIEPETLNLASKGNWLTCYIWLPEAHNVANIDPNSVFIEDEIVAQQLRIDGQVAIVKFSRSEVQSILSIGENEITITGELLDGTIFEGIDTIRVINKGGKN